MVFNRPKRICTNYKIDDINIIIGQQQLECIDQIINIFKNKNNKKEKIDYIRKINIQKSVNWCEKFKIPCNKFIEKTNIFLPVTNTKDENNVEIKDNYINGSLGDCAK